jgi:hypothetical protein
MSASKAKRNKKYKPRANAIPIAFRFNSDDERTLQLAPHAELLKLRTGNADESAWHTLTCRLNIGMTLAHMGEQSDEAKRAMHASLEAMRSVLARNKETGKWSATGSELTAIGDGLVLTDEMQKASTRRVLRDAMHVVFKEAAVYKEAA